MASVGKEEAVVALEGLYSGPMKGRELAQVQEIFAFLRSSGQVDTIIPLYAIELATSTARLGANACCYSYSYRCHWHKAQQA